MSGAPIPAAVVVASDGVIAGTRQDVSGDVAEQTLVEAGFEVAQRIAVPDETDVIAATLEDLIGSVRLIVTSGGTGFGPRDVTPEATLSVIDRRAAGLEHLMLTAGISTTRSAALSRAVAGSAGTTLIINTPGSAKAVAESLGAVLDLVPHILDLLEGKTAH